MAINTAQTLRSVLPLLLHSLQECLTLKSVMQWMPGSIIT